MEENKIPFSVDMKKDWIFELIHRFKLAKKMHIDRLIAAHGHTALRLPLYMCELNPIELAWAELKRYMRGYNL